MSKEAMKLALEVITDYRDEYGPWSDDSGVEYVIKALEEALKQEQDEPDYWLGYGLQAHTEKPFEGATPLYTTPRKSNDRP